MNSELEQRRWWGPPLGAARVHPELDLVIAEDLPAELAPLPAQPEPARRYLLLRSLHAPSVLAMYVAADALLGRLVVLKLLDSRAGDTTESELLEARAAARLEHPNIVALHELARFGELTYLVFAYCPGETLLDWAPGRPWPEVLARLLEVGEALRHCHGRGLVHGDVKPANILVCRRRGHAVLLDFGLAGPPDLVETFGGTPGFIAPELTEGRKSPAADVYALACTAWVSLVGQPPHPGKSAVALLIAARDRLIRWPTKLPSAMPAGLLGAIAHGLEPDQRRRPSLDDWLAVVAHMGQRPQQRSARRRQALLIAILLVFAALLAASGVFHSPSAFPPCPHAPPKCGGSTVGASDTR